MKNGSFLKVIGLEIEALESRIVVDVNRQNMDEAYEYMKKKFDSSAQTTWIILPCSYSK